MVDSRPNVWQMQSRHDVNSLIQALRYPDPEVRGRAAVALRTLDAVPAVPALKAALQDELDEQAHRYLKEALHMLDQRTDVSFMAQTADLDGLISALKSNRAETVIGAAHALGRLGNRLAVEPLIILFQTSTLTPAVRLAAAEALLELKSAPAVVTLLGALRRDSWQVRRNAAAVLGQIQAIWAVEPLAHALYDPHPVVRRTAAAALKRIGTTEAVTAIRNAVRDAQASSVSKPDVREGSAPDEQRLTDAASLPGETRSQDDHETAQETPAAIPQPQPASANVEQGETRESHETHPSDTTQPIGGVYKLSQTSDPPAVTQAMHRQEPMRANGEAPDVEPDKPERGPIARMIAFLRRRGQ